MHAGTLGSFDFVALVVVFDTTLQPPLTIFIQDASKYTVL